MRSRWASLTLAASAFTLLTAAATPAASNEPTTDLATNAVATAGSSYLPGTVAIREGEELSFLNLDASRHSVTSKATGDDGLPAFDSGILGFAGQGVVAGVASLKASVQGYAFFCQMHPWMQGSLIDL